MPDVENEVNWVTMKERHKLVGFSKKVQWCWSVRLTRDGELVWDARPRKGYCAFFVGAKQSKSPTTGNLISRGN